MTQLQYLALGFSLVWLLLAVYIAGLYRRTERARREVDSLRRSLEERLDASRPESGKGSGCGGGSY